MDLLHITLHLSSTAFTAMAPQRINPLLIAIGGVIIAGAGFYLLLRILFSSVSRHSHAPGTSHRHALFGRHTEDSTETTHGSRFWPITGASILLIVGLTLIYQALPSIRLSMPQFSKDQLGPVLFVIGLGLVLGMRHSTDADHVVAISTIVSKQRSIRNAALIGSVWGLGHTITIFIVGALIILFGIEIPPRLGLSMEFCVALMLILLGILNLTGLMQRITSYLTPGRATAAEDPSTGTTNIGDNAGRETKSAIGRMGAYQLLRPLVIGLVHGLAGSAAVALLVLSTIHDPVWATVYLLIFGAGTMIGMMCMTAAIAVPLTYAGDRFTRLSQYLGTASGMASLCFGTFLVYQLGFLGGLFTSHPQWTPR